MKRATLEKLLQKSEDGKLPRGTISEVVRLFSMSRKSIYPIWKDGKPFGVTLCDPPNFSSSMVKTGRKRVELNFEQIKNIPLRLQANIRSLSKALDGEKSTIHRRIKEGYIQPHSNTIKPFLSDENKRARVEFCISMIDSNTLSSKPSFVDMYNQVHIDEKWFYLSNMSQKYYLHPDKIEPIRTCKSNRYIDKVMFVTIVAHPRFHPTSNKEFDGKIGIWALVTKEPAKRNSKNRMAGTLETKPILSATKEVIQSCLIEKVLLAIIEKLPCSGPTTIYIQQDNANPHLDINDVEFVEAVRRMDLTFVCVVNLQIVWI